MGAFISVGSTYPLRPPSSVLSAAVRAVAHGRAALGWWRGRLALGRGNTGIEAGNLTLVRVSKGAMSSTEGTGSEASTGLHVAAVAAQARRQLGLGTKSMAHLD